MIQGDANTTYYGMEHDLGNLIDTHLFVLCPNNSGSTFLKNVMAHSGHTWNLKREGQRSFGFVGPRGWDTNRQLIWAARPRWVREYVQPSNFDWGIAKTSWYSQATSTSTTASILVEKSPPFILIPDQLADAFANSRFVLMARDPYAMYEGIVRRGIPNPPDEDVDPRVLAAQHVVACLQQQAMNRFGLGDRSCFFTYEQLCEDPQACAAKIALLAPRLDGLDLSQRTSVKQMYNEPLRNMNDEQIALLSGEDRSIANSIFAGAAAVLDQFGYEVR